MSARDWEVEANREMIDILSGGRGLRWMVESTMAVVDEVERKLLSAAAFENAVQPLAPGAEPKRRS